MSLGHKPFILERLHSVTTGNPSSSEAGGAASTALGENWMEDSRCGAPALPGWANFCRASGTRKIAKKIREKRRRAAALPKKKREPTFVQCGLQVQPGLLPLRAASTARTFTSTGCKYSPHPTGWANVCRASGTRKIAKKIREKRRRAAALPKKKREPTFVQCGLQVQPGLLPLRAPSRAR